MDNNHYIPRSLDASEKIGIWDYDEALVVILPFLVGILSSHLGYGLGGAMLALFAVKKAKSNRLLELLPVAIYWYLPSWVTRLQSTPPSHIRYLAS